MSSTQVVKMLVTTNNSPQEYTSPDDQPTTNVGLINKVDMVCLSPVGYGV